MKKIGLFFLDEALVKEQILFFLKYLEGFSDLEVDIHLFVKNKQVSKRKVLNKTNFFKKLIKSVYEGRFFLSFKNRIYAYFNDRKIIKKFNETAIKSNVHKIVSINSVNTHLLIKKLDLDYGVFILYDEIVKEKTLKLLKKPLNVHPAHLPNFRGCQPLYWLNKEGEDFSCLTMHVMTKGIDEGDIIFEVPFEMNNKKSISKSYEVMLNKLPLTLLFGLRRLLLFDFNGINQITYQGTVNYYKRPNESSKSET